MAAPQDKDYVTACGKLASALSISIAAARRKVDVVASKEGVRDPAGRLLIAQRLLLESEGVGQESRQLLDVLLEAVAEEANYLGDD
ncbi:MAG: hypothetical protein RLZZ459_176 [Cyanobacteriota bacterium]|jgi:hypothetical protein|nr:hypothetical protein [Cyanobacteria bacterium K_DeepCast_35m_m1_288]